jgi:hypothetical protein
MLHDPVMRLPERLRTKGWLAPLIVGALGWLRWGYEAIDLWGNVEFVSNKRPWGWAGYLFNPVSGLLLLAIGFMWLAWETGALPRLQSRVAAPKRLRNRASRREEAALKYRRHGEGVVERKIAIEPLVSEDEQIIVLAPSNRAHVNRTFTIHGLAKTFEGNVVVEKEEVDGSWLVVGVTSAGMMDGLSPFSVQVTLPPGAHVLRIGTASPKDGTWSGVEVVVSARDIRTPPASEVRVLGQGMMHVEFQGLTRRGSYDRISVDVIALLQEIAVLDAQNFLATDSNTLQGPSLLGPPAHEIVESAIRRELVQRDLDADREPPWSITLTEKGRRLLDALQNWSG